MYILITNLAFSFSNSLDRVFNFHIPIILVVIIGGQTVLTLCACESRINLLGIANVTPDNVSISVPFMFVGDLKFY
jgi:hypothetical protein